MNEKIHPGSYILLINLRAARYIIIGRRGKIYFRAGWYAYVGSAMRGLGARLSHHLKENKRLHWHIDYLLQAADVEKILAFEANSRLECRIAGALVKRYPYVSGFGCSDCKCQSHLFYAGHRIPDDIVAVYSGWTECMPGGRKAATN